jgi:hypothetical protein
VQHPRKTPIDIRNNIQDDPLPMRKKKAMRQSINHIPSAYQVVLNDGGEAFGGDIFSGGWVLTACVIDQDMQRSTILVNELH